MSDRMTRPAHTALPWAVWDANRGLILGGRDKHGDETMVACVRGASPHTPQDGAYVPKRPEAEANAALIVRAVNCHDELVKALEIVVGWSERDDIIVEDLYSLALPALKSALARVKEPRP